MKDLKWLQAAVYLGCLGVQLELGERDTECANATSRCVLVSLLARPGDGAVWSQLAALLLMAPAAWLGGVLARRDV